jgi:hypothetical protein
MWCQSSSADASNLSGRSSGTQLGCRSSGTKLDASNLSFSLEKVASSSAKCVAQGAVPNGMLQNCVQKVVVPNWLFLESVAVPTWMLQSCVEKVASKLP